LDLLEGVLIDLLKTKWETFVKAKFYRQFYIFTVYFFISLAAFGLRPKAFSEEEDDDNENGKNSTLYGFNLNETNSPVKSFMFNNLTETLCNYSSIYQEAMTVLTNSTDNSTSLNDDGMDDWTSFSSCPILDVSTFQLKVKLVAEGMLSVFALYYILTALRELRFLGAKMFFENLVRSSSQI
jgi:transient receptor potential cation channel subfamily V member 5